LRLSILQFDIAKPHQVHPHNHLIYFMTTLPPRSVHLRVLTLKRHKAHLLARIRLQPKQAINPLQNYKEAIRLSHMFLPRYEPYLLDRSMLQREVIIVDREDLVSGAID